jgi:hypothetical protein
MDGSLSVYVQPRPPAARDRRTNWLPAPDGRFQLVLRLFWPMTDALARGWSPPPLTRVA